MIPLSAAKRRAILEPADGTALARARDFGIDLSLIVLAVELTPEERFERAIQAQRSARVVLELRRGLRRA